MSGSGRKNAVCRPLSRIRPLIHHRFAAVPLPRRGRLKSFPYGGAGSAQPRLRRGVMSGSGRKNAVYRPLSRIRPLIHHRFAAVPLPRRGRLKSFPYGRCVAQRIESNIAAGWQLYHKKWSWLGAAETEEGRNERERQEKRSMPTALAHKAPHPPPLRGGPPSPEGKVGG